MKNNIMSKMVSLIISLFGVRVEMQQLPIQCHKEPVDREVVAAIMQLQGVGASPVMYSNESRISVCKGYKIFMEIWIFSLEMKVKGTSEILFW